VCTSPVMPDAGTTASNSGKGSGKDEGERLGARHASSVSLIRSMSAPTPASFFSMRS
jgi:hypothetical protein